MPYPKALLWQSERFGIYFYSEVPLKGFEEKGHDLLCFEKSHIVICKAVTCQKVTGKVLAKNNKQASEIRKGNKLREFCGKTNSRLYWAFFLQTANSGKHLEGRSWVQQQYLKFKHPESLRQEVCKISPSLDNIDTQCRPVSKNNNNMGKGEQNLLEEYEVAHGTKGVAEHPGQLWGFREQEQRGGLQGLPQHG